MKKLTPTSYALLGLLARKPWSAYELNAHMQYSVLNAFWPRAASGVYTEPKKLVSMKLATAREEERNGRMRTVYAITTAGRRELQDWLARPTDSHVSMSFEGMLKFLYSESADLDTLQHNVDAIEQAALHQARAVLDGVQPVLELKDEESSGMPYNGMALNYLADVIETQVHWAREVKRALRRLEETGPGESTRREGAKAYGQLISRLEALLEQG